MLFKEELVLSVNICHLIWSPAAATLCSVCITLVLKRCRFQPSFTQCLSVIGKELILALQGLQFLILSGKDNLDGAILV